MRAVANDLTNVHSPDFTEIRIESSNGELKRNRGIKMNTTIIDRKIAVLMTFEGIKRWRGYATYLHNDSRRQYVLCILEMIYVYIKE